MGAPAAFALAAVSGMAYAAAFPPLSWSMAAWLALVPLLVACAALSPLRAAIAGMCWTATMAVGVGWFLPAMLSHYFGLAAVPSWLAAVAIAVGLHGVYVSSYAAWVAWLVQRRAANPVLLAGGWLVCEFARAHGVLGSPWALTAYSQVRSTQLIQIADLAGPYGIGMLVAGVNACVAAVLVPALRGRRPLLGAATIAAALAGAFIYGQWRLGQSFADGPAVRRRRRPGRRAAGREGAARGAAGALCGADHERRGRADRADRLARIRGRGLPGRTLDARATRCCGWPTAAEADLILGGPHYAPSASGTRYHNSVYLVRDGRLAARYDKHRLVPFAEDDRLDVAPRREDDQLHAGRRRVRPAGHRRCASEPFCASSRCIPHLVREAVRQGAEVLVNLSNDAWFGACRAGAPPARDRDAARGGESPLSGARRVDRLLGRDRSARAHAGARVSSIPSKCSTRPCTRRTPAHHTNAGVTPWRGW